MNQSSISKYGAWKMGYFYPLNTGIHTHVKDKQPMKLLIKNNVKNMPRKSPALLTKQRQMGRVIFTLCKTRCGGISFFIACFTMILVDSISSNKRGSTPLRTCTTQRNKIHQISIASLVEINMSNYEIFIDPNEKQIPSSMSLVYSGKKATVTNLKFNDIP